MKSKIIIIVLLLLWIPLLFFSFFRKDSCHRNENSSKFEYKVFSLAEMFENDPVVTKKITELMVNVKVQGGVTFTRTDLDCVDYQKALDRLSKDGWQFVAVTKSNYWIFRR